MKQKHYFSLRGAYPKYLHSIAECGDSTITIENSELLCSTKGRIINSDFVFTGTHDIELIRNDLYGYCSLFMQTFLKLGRCFDFITEESFIKIGCIPESDFHIIDMLRKFMIDGVYDLEKIPGMFVAMKTIHDDKYISKYNSYGIRYAKHIIDKRERRRGFYNKIYEDADRADDCYPFPHRYKVINDNPGSGVCSVNGFMTMQDPNSNYNVLYHGGLIKPREVLARLDSPYVSPAFSVIKYGPLYPKFLIDRSYRNRTIVPSWIFTLG